MYSYTYKTYKYCTPLQVPNPLTQTSNLINSLIEHLILVKTIDANATVRMEYFSPPPRGRRPPPPPPPPSSPPLTEPPSRVESCSSVLAGEEFADFPFTLDPLLTVDSGLNDSDSESDEFNDNESESRHASSNVRTISSTSGAASMPLSVPPVQIRDRTHRTDPSVTETAPTQQHKNL